MSSKEDGGFPFELLQDFQVKFSLLTVKEEKELIISSIRSNQSDFSSLVAKEVVTEPCSLTLDEKVLAILGFDNKKASASEKLPSQFTKVEQFLKSVGKTGRRKISESTTYKLIRTAINEK